VFPAVSLCFLLFPGISWYFLVFPGVSWCFLVSPCVSCCFLVFPGVSCRLLVFPGVSWCLLAFPGISLYLLVFPGISWLAEGCRIVSAPCRIQSVLLKRSGFSVGWNKTSNCSISALFVLRLCVRCDFFHVFTGRPEVEIKTLFKA